MIEQLKNKYPSLIIKKEFPVSGQKQVYLVSTDEYGLVMLKTIKRMDERIRREIELVNSNTIHGVPKIIESSSIMVNGEEKYYFFEEYIDGTTLSSVLKKGPLGIKDGLNLFENLLSIVVELEQLGIVHRDIKPDNIILATDGSFHLIDFGIARNLNLSSLTLTDAPYGPHTPGYGAPELFQYNKALIDSRADLFSVGVVMYESLIGKHPFITGKEANVEEIWYRTATVDPQSISIQGDSNGLLFGLIQTLMKKQVILRPRTARQALEWFLLVKASVIV